MGHPVDLFDSIPVKLRVYFIVTSLRFFLFLSSPWIIPKREASGGVEGSGGKKIWSQVTVHYLLSKIIPRISLYHTAKWRKICSGTNESSRGKFSRVFTSSTFEKIICVETERRIDISCSLDYREPRFTADWSNVSIINDILKPFLRRAYQNILSRRYSKYLCFGYVSN